MDGTSVPVSRPERVATIVCLGDSLTRWGHTTAGMTAALNVESIVWQSGTGKLRYTFSGSPVLAAVVVGNRLAVKNAANPLHNGVFTITAFSDAFARIDVTNAGVTDATTDVGSGSPAEGYVVELYQARSLYGSFPYQIMGLALDEPRMWGVRVYNEGFSGEKADAGVARYAADVSAKNPDIVILQYGTNDLSAEVPRTKAAWLADMETLVQNAQADGALVILMTIPDSTLASSSSVPEWNTALEALAAQYEVFLYDWYGALGEATISNAMFTPEPPDIYNVTNVVHLSWAGNRDTSLGLFLLIQKQCLQGAGYRTYFTPYHDTNKIVLYNQASVGPGAASRYYLIDSLATPVRKVFVQDYMKRQMGSKGTTYKVAEAVFRGTSVGVVSGHANEQGQIRCDLYRYEETAYALISSDTVDLYDPAVWFTEVVWQKHGLDLAQYYVEITLLNTKNAASSDYLFAFEGLISAPDPRYRAYT